MEAINFDDAAVQQQAKELAASITFQLPDHNDRTYDELLCRAFGESDEVIQLECFHRLAQFYCYKHLQAARRELRVRFAGNVLDLIEVQGRRPGDVFREVGVPHDRMGKLRRGSDVMVKPEEIIGLAFELGVDIAFLFRQFADKEELQRAYESYVAEAGEETALTPEAPAVNGHDRSTPASASPSGNGVEQADTEAGLEVPAPEEPPPAVDPDTLELEWVSETVIRLGEDEYDISTKEVRNDIVRHLRAAKEKRTFLALLEKAGLEKKGSAWLSSVEKGTSRIYREQLEALAKAVGVSVAVLLTGYGLDPARMVRPGRGGKVVSTANALVPIPERTLTLPPVSAEAMSEFFRNRVMRKGVEPAEGRDLSEILDLIRDQGLEQVDWAKAWMELTAEGSKFVAQVMSRAEKLRKYNQLVRTLYFTELYRLVFAEEEKPAAASEE